MRHVFVSYAREDLSEVLPLERAIRARGIALWLDTNDIQPGRHWAEEVADAIRRACVVVLVISGRSMSSRHVLSEVCFAAEHAVPVIPIRLDDAPLSAALREHVVETRPLDVRAPATLAFRAAIDTIVGRCAAASELQRIEEPKLGRPAIRRDFAAYDVFVAYARHDAPATMPMLEFLRRCGLRAFADPTGNDMDFTSGTRAEESDAAIQSSRVVLLVISSRSVRSPRVRAEVDLAVGCARPIVPVRLDAATLAGRLQFHLAGLHYLELPAPSALEYESALRGVALAVAEHGGLDAFSLDFSSTAPLVVWEAPPRWKRVAALWLDLAWVALFVAAGALARFATDVDVLEAATLVVVIVGLPCRDLFRGASPGKRLVGLTVVDIRTMVAAGPIRAIVRQVLRMWCGVFGLLDGMVWLLAADGRGATDLLCSTWVVQRVSSRRQRDGLRDPRTSPRTPA